MRNQTVNNIKLFNPDRNFPEIDSNSTFCSKTVFAIFETGQIASVFYDFDSEKWCFDSDWIIDTGAKFMWFECPVNSNDVNW